MVAALSGEDPLLGHRLLTGSSPGGRDEGAFSSFLPEDINPILEASTLMSNILQSPHLLHHHLGDRDFNTRILGAADIQTAAHDVTMWSTRRPSVFVTLGWGKPCKED